ncbi:MAG: hypothetical protein ABIT05_08490 [Chitinophagaceae bacterium]
MEVHAHTHTSRKKWTHYLWEFLMLFLAVFCGFLAENKREHIVEHNRAKEYAKNLLNDLQFDTSEIRRGIHQTKFIMASIDSLLAMSSAITPGQPVPGSFYYYSKFTFNGFRIDWSKSTIDQLIQSGSLRYFSDKELVGTMNFYYYMQGIISAQNQMDLVHRDKITDIRNSILQSRYYTPFTQLDIAEEEKRHIPSPLVDSLMNSKLPLQPGAMEKMDEYINNIADRKSRLKVIVDRYYTLTNRVALKIIKLLSEEFHFKEEDFVN